MSHPISISSGSMNYVLTMMGVTREGPEEVDSLRLQNSLIYSFRLMGEAFSGRDPVIDLRCLRYFLCAC